MPIVDLAFELQGSSIPLNYHYALFGSLSRIVPELHGNSRIGVHPIRGMKLSPGVLTLVPQSRLRLRLPSEEIGTYLAIAGQRLELDGSRLSVGIPRVESLVPAPRLMSRLVMIGHLREPSSALASLNAQLASLGISAFLSFLPDPLRPDTPCRRILRLKGRSLIGFALSASGLSAEDSLKLQEHGLGSRRRMGCGVFVRVPDRTASRGHSDLSST